MAKKKKKKELGTSSARQEKVALKQTQKKSVSSTPKTTYSAKSNSAPVKKTASVENRINTKATTDATRKSNPQRSVVKPNNSLSNSSASRISQANNYLKENRSALSSKDYYSLKRDVDAAAKRNAGNWDGMKMITRGGFTKKEQEKLKKTREKQGRKAIGDADYNAKGEGNRGSAAKTKKKEATGTEKLRKSPSWNQTQEERFLNQRQYQRTQADKSADKLKSKAANAKDAAETEVSVFKNYGKYVDAASRHAKENVEKYKQTGDAKYLKDAKQEVDLGKVFQKRQQGKIADINRTQEEYVFHQTNLNYDKYLKDTNPEYKFQSKLNDSDKSNKEKRQSAEDWAEKTYKDKFSDISDEFNKKSLKDEAERLASLENPTEVQQAEIRVLRGYYDKLPAAEKDRRIQDALYAKSGTTISRITQSVGAGAEEALAGIMRLPRMLDDTTTEVMEQFGIDDDPRTEKARRAEAGYSKLLDWLDEKADKLEAKSEQHKANAARNTTGLGKAAVDLGIVATQIAGDMATGGPARALLSMGARVAGSSYNEAKDRGAETGEALAYAGLQAGKEVLTEKIFGAALPFYGKGLASDSVEKMVSKAIDKAAVKASSKAGERAVKTFLTSVANFAEEGAEEGISGVFDPLVTAITIGGKDDLKQYGKQEFWDDVAYQVVLGGAAGVLGGTMEIARNRAPGVDEQTKTELKKEKATKEQQRALNSFVPNRMSEFAQGLVNTGIKTSTAVNTDGVLRKLEDGDPIDDKDIRNTIKQLNPKKDSGKRALDAIGNRFGIDNLSSMEKESDIVKAIRDGAKTVKSNADTAIETAVQSAEAEQQMADIQSRVEQASRDVETAPLTERKIAVEGIGEVGFDTFREELLKYNPDVTEDQVMQGWAQAVQLNGIEPENTDALDALYEPAPQIEGQMDLFGQMGRTDAEEAKFLEDTFGIKQEDSGQMNMFEAMDDDTFKEQTFGIKKEEPYDEMRDLAEQTLRKQDSVLTKNEAAQALPQETQDDLNTLAGNIGYRVEVHDHIEAPEGVADVDTDNAIINGYIDRETNTLHLAMDATDDIETTRSRIMKVVGLHETTHALETLAEPEYMEYSNYVEKHYADLTGTDFATALDNRIKQYAKANVHLDENTARRELMAEYASRMDQTEVFNFVNSNPTIGQKIVDMWKSVVAKLREAFGMSGDAGEALRKWETAYRAATARTVPLQDSQSVRESANSNVEVRDNNGEFVASNDGNGHMMFSVSTLGLSEDETTFTGPGGQVVEGWIADQEDLSDESKKALKDGLIAIYKTVKPIADSGEFEPFTSWSEASVRLDNEGNPIISVVTPNDEYEMNLDHGSVCVKRQTLDAVIEELVRRGSFNDFKMDGPDIVEINRIIGENNFDVTCSICFVEQRRYRQVKLAEEFSDMYNEFVRGMMPEGTDATYFNYGGNQRLDEHNATITNDVSQLSDEDLALDTKYTVERSEKDENGKTKTVNREMTLQELKDEKNDNGGLRQGVDNKIARYLLASPEARHLLDRGDFAYAGAFDNAKERSPKVKLQEGTDTITDIESLFVAKGGAGRPLPSHNPTQYLHEMLADEDKFDVEEAFRIGGVRRQSASDFIPHMFFDYAEEVFDLEARGLPEHTYAKVPSYVWLFGLTGEKMNMSFIPAIDEDGVAPGLDADGNYVWLDGQTFPEEEAYKIADAPGYTKNCGPTAVGASDPHIEKMLDDDRISMIIPYHKSNANPVVAAMNGTSYMVDYTGYQNTRHQDGTKLSASEAKKVPNYNELLRQYEADDNDAPKKAAEDYVRWCEDNNYLPKFDQFAYAKDENGDYIVNEDGRLAVRDGYYKVLTDFKLYDKDGNYCPQEAVKQRYPDNLEEILRDALKGETELEENRKAKVSAITDTVENVLRNDLRQKALTAKEVAADKARVKALNDENTARYKAEQEKRRAALRPKSESTVQYSLWKRVDPNQEQYKDWDSNSPRPVETIRPSSSSWTSGPSFADVKKRYPELFTEVPKKKNKANKKGHGSQSTSTENTYNSIFDRLEEENFDGTILDASSGQGLGTRDGKERGFSIEDVEPFPPDSEFHVPDYKDYNAIDNTYDFIISNAVLNVEPQDQRDATIVRMGELLNDGGRMYINVRGISDVEGAKTKQPVDPANHEWYIPNSRSYQKGFTAQELKAYVEDALGDEYTVETAMNGFPKPSNAVTVMVYKGNSAPQYSLSFNKNIEDIDPTKPLKTLQGSTIKRAQNNVGKEIGGQIYVHKNYASDTKIPADVLARGEELVPDDFEYNSVMWDKAKPNEIRFDEAPDFDTATEPQVGHFLKINTETGNITAGYSPNIWHHKWLWVKDDYDGFDTREAYDRSQTWLSQVKGTAKGTIKSWNKQLEENGMEPIDSEPVPKNQEFLDRYNSKPKGIFPTKEEADRANSKAETPKSNVQFSISPTGKVEGFYSELQNTINGSKQHKMKPSQWLQYAKGHGQIKQEEIDYSGILSLPDESITKEDLLDYLRANQIELEEETLTPFDDNPEEYSYVDPETDELLSFSDIEDRIENEEIPYYIIDRYKLRGRDAVDVDYRLDFGDYRYNGSASLKVVAEFSDHGYPREITVGRFEISDLDETLNNKAFDYSHWDQYTTPGGSNYREILLKIPGSEYTNSAMDYHWGESFEIEGRTGIISHARVNDFTNEKGDKVLFVEEIQSDWHNQGQKKGYYDKAENNTEVNVFNDNLPAPDAPFKDSYVSLTLKRLLSEAVENGYDRLAWTTAQMQSDRWLERYAEGYRIEYDQEIPKFLNKYVKKWGSKVESMEMLGKNVGTEEIPVQRAYEVPSIPITDAMRESISTKGQPQFSLSEKQNDKTSEVLRKMYESLGLSPHAQPMELRPNAKPEQSKVNANTFTNTGIFELATEEIEDDELKTRAKNAGKQVKERGKYDRVSEQESMATAKTRLETDYEGEKRKLSDETREWTGVDLDTAMGIASSELAKGNIDEFDKWTDIIQRMGTRAGQLIQAFAKYSRTPEGVAVQAKKALDELGKVNPEKKAELKETVNRLTKQLQAIQKGDLNALIDQFLEQAKIRNTKVNEKKVRREFANATWQRDYNRVVTQLLAIPTDYIKASKGQKVATYQTLSHLLNLRTNNRNILSNFVFGEVETLANDLATIPDFFIGLATGKRTVGLEGPGLAPKALKAGWERGRQTALDVRADIMPLDSDTKYGTTRRTWKKASSNPLERGMSNLEMILGYELNVTDEFAKGQHETRIRKGLQKWVDKGMYSEEVMDQFAEQEMLYRTFQDDTFLGTVLAGIKNHLNYIGFGHTGRYLKGNKYEIKEFGLGDLVQKYTTVPGALGTRVVEYSPVGYMKMFYNMAQLHEARKNLKTEMAKEKPGDKRLASIETDLLNYQRALALSMSRATTGSGLVIGLYLLKGLIKSTPDSGDDDDDKNAAAIRTLQGLSGTQINISALGRLIKREDNAIDWRDGDTLYDLTFLEPMNGLMDISAQMVQDEDVDSLKDEDFWKDLFGNSLESIYETFMDLPTMQQLNSIQMELRYHDDDMMKTIPTIGLELMKGSATGFVPAPVRQMAQARDEYYRETYQSQDLVDNTRDALMNSIPGLREKLPTKQDSYGRDKEQEFLRRRALNAFVNPGKTSTYKVSPLEKEIADIASSTDDEYKLYPDRKAPKKLSFGSKKELTNAEKRKYMQILGGTYTSEMNDLIQSEDYKEASVSEKEKMLLDRRTFADMEAKAKLAEAFKTTYSKTSTVDKVLAHRDMGYSDKQWAEIEKGMTNPESGSVNQEYAKPYLDSIKLDEDPAKDRQKKAEIWRAMGWVDYDKKGKKKNPYL